MIEVKDLTKEFRSPQRVEGPFSGVRTLFTRRFDTRLAVDRVSFSIDRGEVVGYLARNGAGKSTTIKMLTGILYPTSGVVEVDTPVGQSSPLAGPQDPRPPDRRGVRAAHLSVVGLDPGPVTATDRPDL